MKINNINNILNKPVFVIIMIFVLINLSTVSSFALVKNQNNDCSDCKSHSRYVIKFKEMSILEYFSQIKENINDRISALSVESSPVILTKMNNFRNKLKSIHNQAKTDILKLIDRENDKNIFLNEFFNVFNGLVVENINPDAVEKIKSLSYVKSVFYDFKIKTDLHESVPLINATEVWKLHDMQGNNITGKGVTIAILDTGVNYNLPELGGGFGPDFTVVDGYDFVTCEDINGEDCYDTRLPDKDPMDDNGHGTLCASVGLGVAPDVKIYAYKTLNKMGEGWWSWSESAMELALDPDSDGDFSDHVDIISLSAGVYDKNLNPDDELCRDIDDIVKSGIVVVVAAGNNGAVAHINFPGICRESICVGASTKDEKMASFSSRGPVQWSGNLLIKPDVVAPGKSIRCLNRHGNYVSVDGTSFSTPHVAGAAALVLQAHPDWAPNDSKNKVKEELKNTAIKILNQSGVEYNETTQGAGRIDILAAVGLSSNPPIAYLNISGKLERRLINITGTAKNGTGLSKDFINYTLSYKNQMEMEEWYELKTSSIEIENDLIHTWNINELKDGIYDLKLTVRGYDQTRVDIKTVWFGDFPYIDVQIPINVNEKSTFNVVLTDENNESINAIVLFLVPWRIPQIRYGNNVCFKAPNILNPYITSRNGKVIVLKITEGLIISEKIIISNN